MWARKGVTRFTSRPTTTGFQGSWSVLAYRHKKSAFKRIQRGLIQIEVNIDNIADGVADRLRDNSAIIAPRLLTLEQAATYLGLTKDAPKAKVPMGRIPTVDLDKKLRLIAKRRRNPARRRTGKRHSNSRIGGRASSPPANTWRRIVRGFGISSRSSKRCLAPNQMGASRYQMEVDLVSSHST